MNILQEINDFRNYLIISNNLISKSFSAAVEKLGLDYSNRSKYYVLMNKKKNIKANEQEIKGIMDSMKEIKNYTSIVRQDIKSLKDLSQNEIMQKIPYFYFMVKNNDALNISKSPILNENIIDNRGELRKVKEPVIIQKLLKSESALHKAFSIGRIKKFLFYKLTNLKSPLNRIAAVKKMKSLPMKYYWAATTIDFKKNENNNDNFLIHIIPNSHLLKSLDAKFTNMEITSIDYGNKQKKNEDFFRVSFPECSILPFTQHIDYGSRKEMLLEDLNSFSNNNMQDSILPFLQYSNQLLVTDISYKKTGNLRRYKLSCKDYNVYLYFSKVKVLIDNNCDTWIKLQHKFLQTINSDNAGSSDNFFDGIKTIVRFLIGNELKTNTSEGINISTQTVDLINEDDDKTKL